MKKFSVLTIGEEKINGIGYYQKISDGIVIKAVDHSVLKLFIGKIRESTVIPSLLFEGEEANGAYGGDFMVKNITDNTIYLQKI